MAGWYSSFSTEPASLKLQKSGLKTLLTQQKLDLFVGMQLLPASGLVEQLSSSSQTWSDRQRTWASAPVPHPQGRLWFELVAPGPALSEYHASQSVLHPSAPLPKCR